MFGMNYAWHNFAGDFGGIAGWGKRGVTAGRTRTREPRRHPCSRGERRAVVGAAGAPGRERRLRHEREPDRLGGTTRRDDPEGARAAKQADVNLIFFLFSFDNFHPTPGRHRREDRRYHPHIVNDAERRAKLIDKVVKPLAKAVEQSPYRRRMIAWDVINEPSWP